MIRVYPFAKLGEFQNDWLHARYHFSFSNYYNEDRMGFGNLRVINDDTVKAASGFPTHGHRDMEIITYVRTGEIRHRDSLGNEGATKGGDVQVMSAGTGIMHSEFSSPSEDTLLYQIWIIPNKKAVEPRWEAKEFPKDAKNELSLLVSGRKSDEGKGALFIHQDAAIYGGRIEAGKTVNLKIGKQAYILVSKGEITVNGTRLGERDGAEVENENELQISANGGLAEVLVIDI
jgi:hypothetical protein